MYVSLYETYLKMQESYTFYYAPQMENYLDLETRFENLSRLKLMAGRAQYQKGSSTAEELVWDTLDSFKLDFGTSERERQCGQSGKQFKKSVQPVPVWGCGCCCTGSSWCCC